MVHLPATPGRRRQFRKSRSANKTRNIRHVRLESLEPRLVMTGTWTALTNAMIYLDFNGNTTTGSGWNLRILLFRCQNQLAPGVAALPEKRFEFLVVGKLFNQLF